MSPVTPFLALLVCVATFRLARLFTMDFVMEPFRDWVAKRFGAESKLAYLSECPWCLSMWLAVPVVVVATLWPDNRWVIAGLLVLTASAVAGLITTLADTNEEDDFDDE